MTEEERMQPCTRERCCKGAVPIGAPHTRAHGALMYLQSKRTAPAGSLRELAELPVPRLVEYRCQKKGHLLAIIYETHAGPLFVPTPYDAISRGDREFVRGNRAAAASMHALPVLVDEADVEDLSDLGAARYPGVVNCKCLLQVMIPLDRMREAVLQARGWHRSPMPVMVYETSH